MKLTSELRMPCIMLYVKTDYLRKVIVHDRSSKYTRVGEIMTDQVGAVYLQVSCSEGGAFCDLF